MIKLDDRIRQLQLQLGPIKESQHYLDFRNCITKKLDKVDRETQKKKVKKFYRDLKDFNSNSIYLWQNSVNIQMTSDE